MLSSTELDAAKAQELTLRAAQAKKLTSHLIDYFMLERRNLGVDQATSVSAALQFAAVVSCAGVITAGDHPEDAPATLVSAFMAYMDQALTLYLEEGKGNEDHKG